MSVPRATDESASNHLSTGETPVVMSPSRLYTGIPAPIVVLAAIVGIIIILVMVMNLAGPMQAFLQGLAALILGWA